VTVGIQAEAEILLMVNICDMNFSHIDDLFEYESNLQNGFNIYEFFANLTKFLELNMLL